MRRRTPKFIFYSALNKDIYTYWLLQSYHTVAKLRTRQS